MLCQCEIDNIKEQGESGTADAIRYGLVHTRPIDEDNNLRWWLGFNYLRRLLMLRQMAYMGSTTMK